LTRAYIEEISGVPAQERERVFLMVRFHQLLKEKYAYSPEQVLSALTKSGLISQGAKQKFAESCQKGDSWQILCAGNEVLLELKGNITDSTVTRATENIYHKRHIAAGIPSMYGTYKELKFDSMGMLIRLITFLKKYLEEIVTGFNFSYITRGSMRQAYEIMAQMLLGLRVCGLTVEDLSTKVELLKRSISVGNFSASQYLNIFEFISRAVSGVVESNYIAVHNSNLRAITRQILRENGCPEEEIDKKADGMAEEFLRWIIASTYAIQEFDLFLTKILHSLRSMTKMLDDRSSGIILNYSPGKLITFISEPLQDFEDQLYLGFKGYALKKLKALALPIPNGFIVSTELFNILPVMSYEDLRRDTRERVVPALRRLEKLSGRRLGDSDRLLLLSVRSGAAFSMPGMMDTILNVGMNDEITEKLSRKPNFGWTSWDCYRRFLQNYAMSCGLDRNLFDEIMIKYKEKYKVTRKLQFTPIQMREMAFEYKSTAIEHGVTFIDDPFDQLMRAIFLVLRSWQSEPAQVYRKQMQLSDDWGTGVIVQRMILGNMNYDSGTGVLFTRNPRALAPGIDLFGDFVMCSQGEDVVAGLVHPYPISEKQRAEYSPDLNISLEKIYPEIYSRLREITSMLINGHGYGHQEIEFTFESSKPEDLYILQTKPMPSGREGEIPVFANPEEMQENLLATGVGVSGGAMSGLVVFTEEDISTLRVAHPDENVILLRPDTVPEDISLVLAVDGVLTGRGGATSHAAVTTKRVGKTCVVNCVKLVVSETNKYARIGSRELRPGDMISIDGHSGFVSAGKHEIRESKEEILPF
jgi:pyruvate,orthophosphate dikinase